LGEGSVFLDQAGVGQECGGVELIRSNRAGALRARCRSTSARRTDLELPGTVVAPDQIDTIIKCTGNVALCRKVETDTRNIPQFGGVENETKQRGGTRAAERAAVGGGYSNLILHGGRDIGGEIAEEDASVRAGGASAALHQLIERRDVGAGNDGERRRAAQGEQRNTRPAQRAILFLCRVVRRSGEIELIGARRIVKIHSIVPIFSRDKS
jgi:hypothetical protein